MIAGEHVALMSCDFMLIQQQKQKKSEVSGKCDHREEEETEWRCNGLSLAVSASAQSQVEAVWPGAVPGSSLEYGQDLS